MAKDPGWKEKVGTPKDEKDRLKAGEKMTPNADRLKYYKDFAIARTGLKKEVLDDLTKEGATADRFREAGLMTREDLNKKEVALKIGAIVVDRPIVSGDTLYKIIEAYFKQLGVTDA